MIVLVFVDLTGSTAAMWQHGATREAPAIVARLAALAATLKQADADLIKLGVTLGDGALFAGRDAQALVRAAMGAQGDWLLSREGLPARLAVGVGMPVWEGSPWAPGSTVRGAFVNLTARLLDVCNTGGIVLTSSAFEAISENPALRTRFSRADALLKGIGIATFWRLEDGWRDMDRREQEQQQDQQQDQTGVAPTVQNRIRWLEGRMDKLERRFEGRLQLATYLLIANLASAITVLLIFIFSRHPS